MHKHPLILIALIFFAFNFLAESLRRASFDLRAQCRRQSSTAHCRSLSLLEDCEKQSALTHCQRPCSSCNAFVCNLLRILWSGIKKESKLRATRKQEITASTHSSSSQKCATVDAQSRTLTRSPWATSFISGNNLIGWNDHCSMSLCH